MSGGNNQGEPAFLLFLTLGLFAGLAWLLWHLSHDFWLNYFFRWLRFTELWVPNLFTHKYAACLDWLRYAPVEGAPSPQIVELTNSCFGPHYLAQQPDNQSLDYYHLSLRPIIALGAETERYYRWPLIIVLGYIGFKILLFAPNNKFLTKHTLESLIETQAKMWPIISPIVKFNPSKNGRILGETVPDKLPLFAEALSPEEWVSFNRIPVVNGIPDREASRRGFIRQLGPRWNGFESLPVHIKGLLATFALKGAQKRDESDDLSGRLALAWSPEKGFRPDAKLVSEIDSVLHDPDLGGKLIPVTNKFAWRTTAVLGALRWARANGGVLAPAQFIWLRAEDRALWYPLNNLGRRSFHSEGAGAMAHFMAEEAAGKPLPIPRVDTAIITLNTYLHDPEKKPIAIPPREGNSPA